jgi:alpha-2-macroglobulin
MNTRLPNLLRRSALLLLLCVLALPGLWHSHGQDKPEDDDPGLRMRLSEGRPATEKPPTSVATPTATAPLPARLTQALLARLGASKRSVADVQTFALRADGRGSPPPPRTGQTINEPFPARIQAPVPATNPALPLEITRFAPEGEVELAPHLSVTFSQPMVAVTGQADAAQTVPVKLSPLPAGQWRWVGTQTLLFEPVDRFPMATRYEVEIPAGTRSAVGGVLAETKRWTFGTPAPEVKAYAPNNEASGTSRNPVFFLAFNQRINPAEALKFISLRSDKGSEWQLRLATAAEIEADWKAEDLVKEAKPETWIAFRAVASAPADRDKPLPAATNFTYAIKTGMPSAEGPRLLAEGWSHVFGTYQPLRIVKHECGNQRSTDCAPYNSLRVQFNNDLSWDSFTTDNVRVEPTVPDLKVSGYGNTFNLQGAFRPRTTYRVTLKATLKDTFEQTLGQDQTVEFSIGKAALTLHVPGGNLVVLDPAGPRSLSIYSVNHESLFVRLYAVAPEEYGKYAAALRARVTYNRNKVVEQWPEIGRRVWADTLTLNAQPDEITETRVDLKPALTNGLGHALLIVEPTANVITPYGQQRIVTWIQATNLALDAFADQTQLLAWATSLKDGQPVANAQLTLLSETGNPQTFVTATPTATNGLAKLRLPSDSGRKYLLARSGTDAAVLPENLYLWNNTTSWQRKELMDDLRWHVFDDRGLYRPGEEVHLKGWLRRLTGGPTGDVALLKAAARIRYVVKDGQDNQVAQGTLTANALGGFDTKFKLPATMNLGFAHVEFKAEGAFPRIADREHRHNFQVQEFRRPEYEVKVTASEGPHFVGGHVDLTVAANYYAGGGLPDTEVSWQVSAISSNYVPPNRQDFTFGKWIPWWNWNETESYGNPGEHYHARTDSTGRHRLRVDFDAVSPARAMQVVAYAQIADVNRQIVTGETRFILHPAALYVGLRSPRTFVQPGEPLVVEAIVTDLDGQAVANREIRMRVVRLDWQFEKNRWQEREVDAQVCVVKSAAEVVKCSFTPKAGGRHRITAAVHDDRERRDESELSLWVAGGRRPAEKDLAQEKVELIPSQAEYKPGDVAELLVQAPFANAEGLLTVRRAGLVTSERFTLAGAAHTLRIPIKDEYTPNIHVQVDLVGATPRTDDQGQPDARLPLRPAFASGELKLAIPPVTRKLHVKATPRATTLEPGGTTTLDVEVLDTAGQPVRGGEVAVVVVDEAVLALTRYETPDGVRVFYPEEAEAVSDYHSRENVLLVSTRDLIAALSGSSKVIGLHERDIAGLYLARHPLNLLQTESASLTETVEVSSSAALADIKTRRNFNALATFAAALPTDARGCASVQVKLPDNLTRYRVMAVAVAGEKQFGSGEAAITARLPLMVRPSAPRFLNFGDHFDLPVVVQNQTDAPLTVDVAVRAMNALLTGVSSSTVREGNSGQSSNSLEAALAHARATDTAGQRVTVPANDRVEVRFPAATVSPGTARFQIGVSSGKWADAAEVSLPVWTPATTEAFATYGELDSGAIAQPVQAPADVFKEFGGLEITTSSTQLQALTDAVLYLTSYPYECSEQIASRVLAIAALRDVLAAFKTKDLPAPSVLLASVNRDLKRLEDMQGMGGAFGFWRRPEDDDESWPYLGLHAAHALARAKAKGFSVPPRMLERSQEYLRDIKDRIPSFYGLAETRVLRAYALYVRQLLGDRDTAEARALLDEAGGPDSLDKLPLEALGWLLPVLAGESQSANTVAAIYRHLNNRVEETAATAHFTTGYKDSAHLLLHSDRRADAILLEALIVTDPKNALIPKLARGLLSNRKAGRWESTQENAWVLLALDRYFNTYEKATPAFIARAWLSERFAGQHAFKGRTTERSQLNVPMQWLLAQGGAQTLTLDKTGVGRLYYRLGMQYAPRDLQLKPADYGFTVTRTYEAIDDPNDVRRQEDGTWRIRAGAQVRVRLTLVAPARRYHVALVDPLPAGFEALNPALATTGNIPQDPQEQTGAAGRRWWMNPIWYEHQNLRDERVEAFTSLLWEGVYKYSYVARATTPGVFVVPPPKAEEMYHPETFGRGASERVVIE